MGSLFHLQAPATSFIILQQLSPFLLLLLPPCIIFTSPCDPYSRPAIQLANPAVQESKKPTQDTSDHHREPQNIEGQPQLNKDWLARNLNTQKPNFQTSYVGLKIRLVLFFNVFPFP